MHPRGYTERKTQQKKTIKKTKKMATPQIWDENRFFATNKDSNPNI